MMYKSCVNYDHVLHKEDVWPKATAVKDRTAAVSKTDRPKVMNGPQKTSQRQRGSSILMTELQLAGDGGGRGGGGGAGAGWRECGKGVKY